MRDAENGYQADVPEGELEALRIAEECARSALRSSENSLAALERAEGSLTAGEERMAEVSAAAVVAAGEATEARIRATEIATDFRLLEEQVAEALRLDVTREVHGPRPSTDVDALLGDFNRRADRIIEQLRSLEADTITIRGPTKLRGYQISQGISG